MDDKAKTGSIARPIIGIIGINIGWLSHYLFQLEHIAQSNWS